MEKIKGLLAISIVYVVLMCLLLIAISLILDYGFVAKIIICSSIAQLIIITIIELLPESK